MDSTVNNDKINSKKNYALHCALQKYWKNIVLLHINCSVFSLQSLLSNLNIVYFSFFVIIQPLLYIYICVLCNVYSIYYINI